MRTEADLTAVRATTGSWFLTLPMLRAIATHLEPIPVGLAVRACSARLAAVWKEALAWSSPDLLHCYRRASSSFVYNRLHSLMGLLQLLWTACSNARAAFMGRPALEPTDPRMHLAMNSIAVHLLRVLAVPCCRREYTDPKLQWEELQIHWKLALPFGVLKGAPEPWEAAPVLRCEGPVPRLWKLLAQRTECLGVLVQSTDCNDQTLVDPTRTRLTNCVSQAQKRGLVDTPTSCPSGEVGPPGCKSHALARSAT